MKIENIKMFFKILTKYNQLLNELDFYFVKMMN